MKYFWEISSMVQGQTVNRIRINYINPKHPQVYGGGAKSPIYFNTVEDANAAIRVYKKYIYQVQIIKRPNERKAIREAFSDPLKFSWTSQEKSSKPIYHECRLKKNDWASKDVEAIR